MGEQQNPPRGGHGARGAIHRRDFLKAVAMAGSGLLMLAGAFARESKASPLLPAGPAALEASPMNFAERLAGLDGFSRQQLAQHEALYQGCVRKLNELESAICNFNVMPSEVNATYHPYRELHVEQTYALNGVVLHELYFGNLGGARSAPSAQLQKVFSRHFGSWQTYLAHLQGVGKAMRGWAITTYCPRSGRIRNYGLDLHNQGAPMQGIPLLVLDVYEHAYSLDFGTNRDAYLNAFLANADWAVVEHRLHQAIRSR